MAAAVDFYINPNAGDEFNLNLGGSGLGFYGANFGDAVAVGAYNSSIYITDSNGVTEGALGFSARWTHANSGIINNTGSGLALLEIPNYQSSLEIRFTNDTACQVNNAKVYIYDRVSINNPQSGVTCKAAEIIHPSIIQGATGSGDTSWSTMSGTGIYLTLAENPGCSGEYAGNGVGSTHEDTVHSFYIVLSCSPDSIGSKTQFGLYFSCEYL